MASEQSNRPLTMGESVAQAQDSADPVNLTQRYIYDPDTNQVRLRENEITPAFAQRMIFKPEENGQFSSNIPQLATANFMGMNTLTAPGFAGMDVENFALWEAVDSNNEGKIDIRRAQWYYKVDPVVFRCVNLLAELANSRITHSSENEDASTLIDNWRKKAMPHSFLQNWFIEYFKVGWVMPFKTLVKYKPKEFKDNRIPARDADGNVVTQAFAAEEDASISAIEKKTNEVLEKNRAINERYEAATAAYEQAKSMHERRLCSDERLAKLEKAWSSAQYEWSSGQIPGAYTLLNPLLVTIEGPREMNLLRHPFLFVDAQICALCNDPAPFNRDVVNSIPPDIREQIKRGNLKIWLSPNICPMIFGDKPPYERYPTPIMRRAYQFLANKQELIEMDRSTARTVKNRILLVKLGSDAYPVFDPVQIYKVQSLFNNPSKNMTFVWNHCIALEWIEPNLNGFMDEKKYEVCDNQTRMAYGITKRLLGANDKSSSTSVLDFEGVKEIVEEAQLKFLEFYQREIDMVRSALNLSPTVEAQFDKLNLQDEMKFWAVLTQAVMNGLIDQQTALETLRFHFPTVVSRMKMMKKLKAQGLFLPMPSANNMGPSGAEPPAKGGIPSGPKGGKPASSPLADNNANRAGKVSKPSKAKAKIQSVGDHVAVIVDMPELDDEHTQDIVDRFREFGVVQEWVMTKAHYEEKYGKIKMFTPYPELTASEAISCIRETNKLSHKLNEAFVEATAAFKETGAKRGPYLTDKIREEIEQKTFTRTVAEYMPVLTGESEEIMVSHIESVLEGLTAVDPDLSDRDARLATAVIVRKRYEKALAQNAAPAEPDKLAA